MQSGRCLGGVPTYRDRPTMSSYRLGLVYINILFDMYLPIALEQSLNNEFRNQRLRDQSRLFRL